MEKSTTTGVTASMCTPTGTDPHMIEALTQNLGNLCVVQDHHHHHQASTPITTTTATTHSNPVLTETLIQPVSDIGCWGSPQQQQQQQQTNPLSFNPLLSLEYLGGSSSTTSSSPFLAAAVPNYYYYNSNHHQKVDQLLLDTNGINISSIIYYVGRMEGQSFIRFATSPEGSRLLQEILKLKDAGGTAHIFRQVLPSMFHLMMDHCGAYVFLRLVESCTTTNPTHLTLIIHDLTRDPHAFLSLILTKNGANSLKKLLKLLKNSPLVFNIISLLASQFYPIMTHRSASYVISECIDQLDPHHNSLLHEAAIAHCLDLAIHKQGCLSLYKFMDNIQGLQRHRLLDTIAANAVFLAQDPAGNYVVQKLLALNNPAFTAKICGLLRGHYAPLCFQRGGSHVVEKCLHTLHLNLVLQELLANTNQLLQIAKDRYGNYVVQKALIISREAESPLYHTLLAALSPHLDLLRFGCARNVHNLVHEATKLHIPPQSTPLK
ncbi:hypothetical protein Tsubulata_047216 [Turnera subulata]|uniref:PUM-HD domain-containing protein n=1 Tax=Turnera subulata TaxID=218843 RepID=A0A9Q0F7T5_9ROSI|nr:hypothetical protein Tsubulata_047216 [Turnera subulata]